MFVLPRLNYDYGALAPAISGEIMELHHAKHHQGYVDKLNKATEGGDYLDDIEQLLKTLANLPESKQTEIRNNGGGHYNHSLFWQWMSPEGGGSPDGHLAIEIDKKYGDFQGLVDKFNDKAGSLFGSGWVWLMPDLDILTTANQDNPIMFGEKQPILGLDVWEHAYYLDYKNQRSEYIVAWWDVVNWEVVASMYERSLSS